MEHLWFKIHTSSSQLISEIETFVRAGLAAPEITQSRVTLSSKDGSEYQVLHLGSDLEFTSTVSHLTTPLAPHESLRAVLFPFAGNRCELNLQIESQEYVAPTGRLLVELGKMHPEMLQRAHQYLAKSFAPLNEPQVPELTGPLREQLEASLATDWEIRTWALTQEHTIVGVDARELVNGLTTQICRLRFGTFATVSCALEPVGPYERFVLLDDEPLPTLPTQPQGCAWGVALLGLTCGTKSAQALATFTISLQLCFPDQRLVACKDIAHLTVHSPGPSQAQLRLSICDVPRDAKGLLPWATEMAQDWLVGDIWKVLVGMVDEMLAKNHQEAEESSIVTSPEQLQVLVAQAVKEGLGDRTSSANTDNSAEASKALGSSKPRVPQRPAVQRQWKARWQKIKQMIDKGDSYTKAANWLCAMHPDLGCSPYTVRRIVSAGQAGLLD